MRDVVFQSNPFEWLSQNLCNKKLVSGSECILYKDEPWGRENMQQAYESYPSMYNDVMSGKDIQNVGLVAGHAEYMMGLCESIYYTGINRPIPIVDQAVYNVLLNQRVYKDITLFVGANDGWTFHAGTMCSQGPHIIDNDLWTPDTSKKYVVVHQYDRVNEFRSGHVRLKSLS